jgi:hypothetical protein
MFQQMLLYRCLQLQSGYSHGAVNEDAHTQVDSACVVRPSQAAVQPGDQLFVPHRKRMAHAYVVTDEGTKELRISYGIKEITFDEQRLFAFGEQLASQSAFTAQEATTWGPGYQWQEIQPLLDALLDEGIIKRGEASDDQRGGGLVPSLLTPSVCPVPRSWSDAECESITAELGGRPVEIGHLESILSVYRIAHPALDTDGRQVGEANVFPSRLRLDRDTEWRVCQYSGSRYRDDRPMNVTALKAMIKHWKPMMLTLLEIRAELLRRVPRSQHHWTVGDMHMFSAVALSLPGFQLRQRGDASPLHPVLSSLFRITDGIRMTTHEMLFLSSERTRAPEEPITAADLFGFAERTGVFLSDVGVCAGPKPLIDEFLNTVFDGTAVQGMDRTQLPVEISSLLAQLPTVVDYGLLGLQVWAVTRSVWLQMSLVYKELRSLFDTAIGDTAATLRNRLDADWNKLDAARIALDYDRDVHHIVYVDCYEQPWQALATPVGPPTLAEQIAARPETDQHRAAAAQLAVILTTRLSATTFVDSSAADIANLLVTYCRIEQAVLTAAAQLQGAINVLLGRPQPNRPLSVRDLRIHYAMYGGSIAQFPYLFDTLEDEFGFHIDCTADTLKISDRGLE